MKARLIGWVCLVPMVLSLQACSEASAPVAVDAESGRAALMAADRAFAESTLERGLDGWMEYFASDAARLLQLGRPAVRGLDEIRRADAGLFADESLRLAWEAVDAGVFDDGRHGFTTGRYQLLQAQAGAPEQTVAEGAYLTWWRREPDGEWRVILDTGAPDAGTP